MAIKSYDYLNRLTEVSSLSGSTPLPSLDYTNNPANHRTCITTTDGTRWVYTYDPLGQLTSGKKYWNKQMPSAGQQFEYTFDDIGNPTRSKAGGKVSRWTCTWDRENRLIRSDTQPESINGCMHSAANDGNRNVMALVNVTISTVTVEYEYGPFGELIRANGPLAFVNPVLLGEHSGARRRVPRQVCAI